MDTGRQNHTGGQVDGWRWVSRRKGGWIITDAGFQSAVRPQASRSFPVLRRVGTTAVRLWAVLAI